MEVDFSGRIFCRGESDEEEQVQRIADRCDPEGGGSRRAGGADPARVRHISQATYYVWKSRYGGARVAELRRLKKLEAENARLKRMYADLALENAAIKDVLSRKL